MPLMKLKMATSILHTVVFLLVYTFSHSNQASPSEFAAKFQRFQRSIQENMTNLRMIKNFNRPTIRSRDGTVHLQPLAEDSRQNLMQEAILILDGLSKGMKETRGQSLKDIGRKVIRRINERAIPAYYVDRIDRDYFTEYFSEIHDEAGSSDGELIEENLDNALLTNVEKEGLFSAYAYNLASEVLDVVADQETNMTFDYCDGQAGSCELAAMLRMGNASQFRGAQFDVNGVKFKLADKLAEKASKLQVFVTSSLRNPYTFDPSVKFTGPVVSIGVKDPEIGLYVTENQTIEISIPLNFSQFQDPAGAHVFQTIAKPLPEAGLDDIPAVKMSLLPNATFSVHVHTHVPVDLYLLIMETYRPLPIDMCRPEVKMLSPTCANGLCNYPVTSYSNGDGPEDELRDYYIGVYPNINDGNSSSIQPNSTVMISLSVYRVNCVFRDDDRHVWSEQGCQVKSTNESFIICSCPHLSTFTSTQLVTPTVLEIPDPRTFAVKFQQNYVIGIAVSILLLVYVLLLLVCRGLDANDEKSPGIHLMVDPVEGVQVYYYLVTVYSGGLLKPLWAQTTSNISMQIYGCRGTSLPYVLREDSQRMEFRLLRNNGVDSFLISSYKNLGAIEKIRIWRDNNGKYPEWYCRKIIVHCLNSKGIYHFFFNRALSVGYFGYATTHDVLAAKPVEIHSWKRRYLENVYDLFSERHTWLSAFQRRPGSLFTRCQRLTCAFSTIFVKLILTFAFLQVFQEEGELELGDFQVQQQQVVVALQIFFLVLPFEVLVRFFFRVSKPTVIPTLMIWPSDHQLSFNNNQIFGMAGDESKPQPKLIPAYFPHQVSMLEAEDPFSIPNTDTPGTETWLSDGIDQSTVVSYRNAEPDYFVRSFEQGGGDGARDSISSSIQRSERIHNIRRSIPNAFTFTQEEGPIEDSIDGEISRNKHLSGVPKKKQTRPKLKKNNKTLLANETERVSELMDKLGLALPPVKVVQVLSEEKPKSFAYVSVGMYPPKKKFCRLPRYCKVLGWIIGLSMILGSAAVAILYGLEVGPIGTKRIFTNMVITIMLSIFVTQPFVILISALVKTTLVKAKSLVEEERFQILSVDKKPSTQELKPYRFDVFKPERFHPPLSQAESFNLKLASIHAHNTKRNLLKLLLHGIHMALLLLVTYSNFSKHEYLAVRNMKRTLKVDTDWADVRNSTQFYQYFEELLENTIYPRQYYDGEPIPYFEEAPIFLVDESTLLMGVPRLHQFRIHPDSICTNYSSPTYCPTEAFIKYDMGSFGPKWLPLSRVSSSLFQKNNVWKYSANADASNELGFIRNYPRGGYIAYLGRNFFRSFAVLHYLDRTNWIDGRTRAIFFQLSTYNANVNLFVYTKLIAEISGSGAWLTSANIVALTLTNAKSYAEEVDNTVLHLVILFAVTMVVLLVKVTVIIYERRVYKALYVADIGLVCMTFVCIVIAWYRLNLVVALKHQIDRQLVNDHIPLDEVAFWDSLQQDLFAVTFAMAVLMIWEFLSAANKEFYMLNLCLYLTKWLLIGQAFLLIILLLGFAMCSHLLFGGISIGFHSLWAAFISLLHEIVNEYIVEEISQDHPILSEIFHLVFTMCAILLAVNLMIALLSQGFEDAKRIAQQRTYWISYLNFIKEWCFFQSTLKPLPFIHPYRLKGMEDCTREFLRACLETPELQRFQRMNEMCKEYLAGTGYSLVSNSWRQRRLRANRRYKGRLELMRRLSLKLFGHRLRTELTVEEARGYSQFSQTILDLKLKKFERKVLKLSELVSETKFDVKRDLVEF